MFSIIWGSRGSEAAEPAWDGAGDLALANVGGSSWVWQQAGEASKRMTVEVILKALARIDLIIGG